MITWNKIQDVKPALYNTAMRHGIFIIWIKISGFLYIHINLN